MPENKPEGHYTAIVEIVHTTPEYKEPAARSYDEAKKHDRQKRDIARFTLRASSLEKLKAKVVAHTELVEEDDA